MPVETATTVTSVVSQTVGRHLLDLSHRMGHHEGSRFGPPEATPFRPIPNPRQALPPTQLPSRKTEVSPLTPQGACGALGLRRPRSFRML